MNKRYFIKQMFIIICIFISLGCSFITFTTPTPSTRDIVFTSAAQTVVAQITAAAARLGTQPALPLVTTEIPSGIMEPRLTMSPTTILTATNIPTDTPTATSSVPLISASIDTNCRFAPNPIYDAVGYLLVGQNTEVIAGLSTHSWWLVRNPNHTGECWVWGTTTNVVGDLSKLPIIRLGSISGWFYVDVNHNAQRDSGEPAIENQVVLFEGTCPPTEERARLQVKISENGRYSFPDLPPGSYCVQYGVMAPLTPYEYSVVLASGQAKDGLNFRLTPP